MRMQTLLSVWYQDYFVYVCVPTLLGPFMPVVDHDGECA